MESGSVVTLGSGESGSQPLTLTARSRGRAGGRAAECGAVTVSVGTGGLSKGEEECVEP